MAWKKFSEDKVDLPGVELPVGLRQNQLSSYLLHLRLEEINRSLKACENDQEEYSRLQDKRSLLIEDAIRHSPQFQTPIDYVRHIKEKDSIKRSGSFRYQEKIWIPQREYPDINFIGLLIGPRGHTLKKMEAETGAKICIRGKGSLKEGKNDPASLAAAEEELHALVMADTIERLSRAVKMINKIIESSTSGPEEANELKKAQLRELAALNGTLKDEDLLQASVVCSNCGATGHRKFECTQPVNNSIVVCKICGIVGHTAVECLSGSISPSGNNTSVAINNNTVVEAASLVDDDYQSFLLEISKSGRN